MNLVKFQRPLKTFSKCYRSLSTLPNAEYTDVPEYPPIEDPSYESKKKREVQSWSDAVRNVKSVEEKQMKLNMPKYYGWKTIMLDDVLIPYNAMPLAQHCTRTHFKESNLPNYYDNFNVDKITEELQPLIEEAILFEHDVLKSHSIYNTEISPCDKQNIFANTIIKQLNRIILNNLSDVPHLSDYQIDLEPRHEAFWFVGGINPPENCRKSREKFEWLKHLADKPINRAVQYMGTPSLAIRSDLPLEPIVRLSEAENQNLDVPFFSYDPKVLGYNSTNRHGTNIPGFWPGEKHQFGLLSYQSSGHMLNRSETFGEKDNQNALHTHGILSSFAWLLGQASYQGFTTFNDITYPLTAQTIITNGKQFSFYSYQLNTIEFHSHHMESNPKRNICYGTKVQNLYEEISGEKLIGFNPEILKTLLKFYVNPPKARDIDMCPYLDKTEPIIAKIADNEKREWLEKQYKHMMANRPRHKQLYEVYHWEKIYKIDHETRVMEPRRRPFELGVNPWSRTYDDRSPSYIPKNLRPGGPKSKPKFYKSYYP